MDDNALKNLVEFDSLATAEKVTGKSYKEDKATILLGMALQIDKSKACEAALTAADDTVFSNDLGRYERIIGDEGFRRVLCVPFTADSCGETMHECMFVYWQQALGILLKFDTFGGNRVNGGKFSYNWKPHARDFPWDATSSGGYHDPVGNGNFSDYVWVGDHDAREALRLNIRRLSQYGTFVMPWVQQPFMWLLHWGDVKGEYDYQAINRERIALLPDEVRRAICP